MAKPRSTANLRQEVRYYYGLEEMSVVHTHPTSKYRYRGENAQAHVDPDQKEVLNQRQAEFIKIRSSQIISLQYWRMLTDYEEVAHLLLFRFCMQRFFNTWK